jgi:hypothetical protein
MFGKLRDMLPANRIAALSGVIVSIGAFLVTLQTSFAPGSPTGELIAKGVVMLGSVLAVLKIIDKFLDGAQNYDSLMHAGVPKVPGVTMNIGTAVANNGSSTIVPEAFSGEADAGIDPGDPPRIPTVQ